MSQQKQYKAKIIKRERVANETVALYLTIPDGFTYKAGQYSVMCLPEQGVTYDEKGNSRYLSIASAPSEDYLLFVAKLGNSTFKDQYFSLPYGTEVMLEEAEGKITIQDENTNLVFLAGGIGVTPFRSIVHHATREKLPHKMVLFHSYRNIDDNGFFKEFRQMDEEFTHFTYIPTVTREKNTPENIKKGRITPKLIKQYISVVDSPLYYVVGSHPFISGMQQVLLELKIPKDRITAEVFCGYCPEHACCCDHI